MILSERAALVRSNVSLIGRASNSVSGKQILLLPRHLVKYELLLRTNAGNPIWMLPSARRRGCGVSFPYRRCNGKLRGLCTLTDRSFPNPKPTAVGKFRLRRGDLTTDSELTSTNVVHQYGNANHPHLHVFNRVPPILLPCHGRLRVPDFLTDAFQKYDPCNSP